MIELNDIWQGGLLVLACLFSYDVYHLLKDIAIDNYIEWRGRNENN